MEIKPNFDLDHALDGFDLPALIAEKWPESGARSNTAGGFKASWRGDSNPSLSLYKSEDGQRWLFKDHGTNEYGNAYQLMTQVWGYEHNEAVQELQKNSSGGVKTRPQIIVKSQPKFKPVSQAVVEKHLDKVAKVETLPEALDGKGFSADECKQLQIGKDRKDAVLAIIGPTGEMLAIKKRLFEAKNGQRYVYSTTGHGSPPWCRNLTASKVLIIEGELNAMALALVFPDHGVMGIAGASQQLSFTDWLIDKEVYIYADNDDAGQEAQARWAEQASKAKAAKVFLLERNDLDACDLKAKEGNQILKEIYLNLIKQAEVFNNIVEAVQSPNVYIKNGGYFIDKKTKDEWVPTQLTNWIFEPNLRLIYPDNSIGERGQLKVNNAQVIDIDLPSWKWNSRKDLLEEIGKYNAVCFTTNNAEVAKIRQAIILEYDNLPKAKGVRSYGLHFFENEWIEVFENETISSFENPPLFYASTPVDPGSKAHASPAIASQEFIEKAKQGIIALPQLITPQTAMAMLGYAMASAFSPRITPYFGHRLPFPFIVGEREAGKTSAAQAVLELATGSSARITKASGMTNYQYDLAHSNANNLLALLDEFRPNEIEDGQLRKHHDLATKWRGSGVAAKDHAYELNAPIIFLGEGMTEDAAALSRGVLYYVEKKHRGTPDKYAAFQKLPLWAYASELHKHARECETISEWFEKAEGLAKSAMSGKGGPRLQYALTYIAFGLLYLQDKISNTLFSDESIARTLKWGVNYTLDGGEESMTNLEIFLEQLGSALVEHRAIDSIVNATPTPGEVIIKISASVKLVRKAFGKDAAVHNNRLLVKYAEGANYVSGKETHKNFKGDTVRGIKIDLFQIPERCDIEQLKWVLDRLRNA